MKQIWHELRQKRATETLFRNFLCYQNGQAFFHNKGFHFTSVENWDADELIWVLSCRRKSILEPQNKWIVSAFWTRKFTNPFLSGDEILPLGTSSGTTVTFFTDQSMSCFQHNTHFQPTFSNQIIDYHTQEEPWKEAKESYCTTRCWIFSTFCLILKSPIVSNSKHFDGNFGQISNVDVLYNSLNSKNLYLEYEIAMRNCYHETLFENELQNIQHCVAGLSRVGVEKRYCPTFPWC